MHRHPLLMTLQQQIETAMREGMKARDERRVSTLRLAMAAAHNRRIELRRDLTDADVIAVLDKQIKQGHESIDLYRKGGRPDRADAEEAEIAILREFMPVPLTEAELEELVRSAIATTGAAGPRDMGRVMGAIQADIKGRADGRVVSDLVRRLLGG